MRVDCENRYGNYVIRKSEHPFIPVSVYDQNYNRITHVDTGLAFCSVVLMYNSTHATCMYLIFFELNLLQWIFTNYY